MSQTEFRLAPTLDSASLTFAHDTNVDANGRFARNTVTFADGAQAYLDIYDTAITGTTNAHAAQLDIRLTNVKYQHHIPWHDPSLRATHMEVLADGNHEGKRWWLQRFDGMAGLAITLSGLDGGAYVAAMAELPDADPATVQAWLVRTSAKGRARREGPWQDQAGKVMVGGHSPLI